jgi:hypothetical protein
MNMGRVISILEKQAEIQRLLVQRVLELQKRVSILEQKK